MKSHLTPESDFASLPQSLFSFRTYQKEDLARAALHDGAIIGWDPGMGKTMAIFTLPFLKKSRFTLIVAPAGLHEQIIDEGSEKFGVTVTPLPDQETALRLMRDGILPLPGKQDPSNPSNPSDPSFFITSYNWLGYNGADEWQPDEPTELLRLRRLTVLRRLTTFPDAHLAAEMAGLHWSLKKPATPWQKLSLPEGAATSRIRTALRTAAMLFIPSSDSELHSRFQHVFRAACSLLKLDGPAADKTLAELLADPAVLELGHSLTTIEQGIGTERSVGSDQSAGSVPSHSIKCVFRPTLASLICGIFDCVICDEAVRLKSGTAYQAQGVLRMNARCRYALTGTPIKNKLPDLFFLASFVTGHTAEAIARWPYGNGTQRSRPFAADFGVLEENLTKAEQNAERGNYRRVHQDHRPSLQRPPPLRILGPVLIRRRKDDVPECDLVSKTIVPIRVMPGSEQQRVYGWHLMNPPEHDSLLASLGAQLQCLRQAALNPASMKLAAHGGRHGRSQNPWTPKSAAILQLATDLMARGEQLVIFSPFQDFSDSLGSASPRPVSLTSSSMGKSPRKNAAPSSSVSNPARSPSSSPASTPWARDMPSSAPSHLVLPSLSWAFDSNRQAIERVHRLTTQETRHHLRHGHQSTIDERLASLFQEKGDASDLALDGRLSTQDREEIDLGQLLRDAVADFDPASATLDEAEVSTQWQSTLLPALTQAGKSCQSHATGPPTSPALPTSTSNIEVEKRQSPSTSMFKSTVQNRSIRTSGAPSSIS